MTTRTGKRTAMGRCICALAVVAGISTVPAASNIAVAQTPVNSIEISVRSPAAIEPELDLRLLLDGTDVTDSSCGPLTAPAAEGERPTRVCNDIPDGTYAVEVSGGPTDAVTVWDCTEIVATPAPSTAIPISAGMFNQWFCSATTALPGVLLDQFGPSDFDDVSTRLVDADGVDITESCTSDAQSDGGRWCTGLADGDYEVRADGVPDGYRSSVGCAPYEASFSGAAQADSTNSFTVDADRRLWQCGRPDVFAPLSFQVAWQSTVGDDATWFENLAPEVTSQDGADVSASCSAVLGSVEEQFFVFDCPGLADGTYSIVVPNIPVGFDVDSTCADVEVTSTQLTEGSACDILVASANSPDVTDPPDDGPVDELPATGTSSILLALTGAALVLTGLAMLVLGGRRRPPAIGV